MKEFLRRLKTFELYSLCRNTILFSVFILIFHFSTNILASSMQESWQKESTNKDPARIFEGSWIPRSLNQEYLVFSGRPKGNCSLLVNNVKVDSNYSEGSGYRSSIFLYAILQPGQFTDGNLVSVACEANTMFPVALTDSPMIFERDFGFIYLFLKFLFQLIPGTLAALAFLLVVYITDKALFSLSGVKSTVAMLAFILSALLYLVSLSQITWIIMSDRSATYFHIFFRVVFSISLFFYMRRFTQVERSRSSYLAFIPILFLVLTLFSRESIWLYYKIAGYSIVVLAFVFAAEILFLKWKKNVDIDVASIFVSFGLITLLDYLLTFKYAFGTNLSVSTVPALIFWAVFVVRTRLTQIRFSSSVSSRIATLTASNQSTVEVIESVSEYCRRKFNFEESSVYVSDLFYRNGRTLNTEALVKLCSTNVSDENKVIASDSDFGKKMFLALEDGLVQAGKTSESGGKFVVYPLGKYAVLNFSDPRGKVKERLGDLMDLFESIAPNLLPLAKSVELEVLRPKYGLQKLKSSLPIGIHNYRAVSLFCDINDYSAKVSKYGESFVRFVSEVYFPRFIQKMERTAICDYFKGDEALFHIVPVGKDTLVPAVIGDLLELLYKYANGEGSELCAANGFQSVTFSAGMSVGALVLEVQSDRVVAKGEVIIKARRIASAAAFNQTLIEDLSDLAELSLKLKERFPIQVKKDLLWVREVA